MACIVPKLSYIIGQNISSSGVASMDKLLLLEDDVSLIDGLTYSLGKQGYKVDVARTVA